MRTVLSVSGDEHGVCEIAVCVVDLNPTYAAYLLRLMDEAAHLIATPTFKHLDALRFWDVQADWHAAEEYDAEISDPQTEDEEDEELNTWIVGEQQRTEMGKVIVRPNEVFWTCYPKHTSIKLESGYVERGEIEAVIKEGGS